jgi:iron(II)-dependent oxidoreductase
MAFCFVPVGVLVMGSEPDDTDAYEYETPSCLYRVSYNYWLARWPVTVSQFAEYLRLSKSQPEDPNCLQGDANSPVVWVSWSDAVAFCRWLNLRWHAAGLLPAGYGVGLPSEPEWEMAARGGDRVPVEPLIASPGALNGTPDLIKNPAPGRRYPWGDGPNPNMANYDFKISATSAVGCFPAGASPCGCEDMSGNVLEWSRSLWGDYPYPEEPALGDKREGLDNEGPRVLRGGAFGYNPRLARCAYRNYADPDLRSST